MENAADALQVVFAIIVFALACILLFQTSGVFRTTAEYIITELDQTKYYTYTDQTSFGASIDQNGNRKNITLEEIIPTIYRYALESYGVTIIDKNGKIVARFDRETENFCSKFNQATNIQKDNLINEINSYVLKPANVKPLGDGKVEEARKELQALFERIYKQEPNNVVSQTKQFDCEWSRKTRMDCSEN